MSNQIVTKTALQLAYAEMDRQFEELKVCHTCQTTAVYGYHATCDHCHRPVCDTCAVQIADGHFFPSCPTEPPF
jgi:hypothetical protein